MNKHFKTLELDKILEILSEKTSVEESAVIVKNITPSFDFDEVDFRLRQTDDAYRLVSYFKSPSFGRVKAIKSSVMR